MRFEGRLYRLDLKWSLCHFLIQTTDSRKMTTKNNENKRQQKKIPYVSKKSQVTTIHDLH